MRGGNIMATLAELGQGYLVAAARLRDGMKLALAYPSAANMGVEVLGPAPAPILPAPRTQTPPLSSPMPWCPRPPWGRGTIF